MTQEDFKTEFCKVVIENNGNEPKDSEGQLNHIVDCAWMAFNRILVRKELGIFPKDPAQGVDEWGRKGDSNKVL